jgi:hypothetical protein
MFVSGKEGYFFETSVKLLEVVLPNEAGSLQELFPWVLASSGHTIVLVEEHRLLGWSGHPLKLKWL